MAVPGEYLIMKRRAQEEHQKVYDDIAKKQFVYKALCDFETSGIKKAQSNAVQYRYDNLKYQRNRDLQGRRARLAELVAEEDQMYETELASLTKTADERKRDMQQRAEALKKNREEKRQAQADAALLRRWRDGADELRAEVQQGITLECMIDRDLQIKEKEHKMMMEMKAEEMYDRMWEQDRQKKIVREISDEDRRQAIQKECADMISVQIDELAQRRADAEMVKWQEGETMRRQCEQQQLSAAKDGRERMVRQLAEREKVASFNGAVAEERSKLMQLELEEDLKLLNTVLAKEKAEDERDKAELEAHKEEMKEYGEAVKLMMIKEASNEAELDKLRQDDQERQWRKREEQWAREKAARDHLLRDVIEERKRQIGRKEVNFMMAKEEEMLERERLIAEMERLATIEEQQAFDRKQARSFNQDVVVGMIKRKEQQQQEDNETEQAERWLQQKADEEYRRRVEAERSAFAKEREAIVQERKSGTGVVTDGGGPDAGAKHGRRSEGGAAPIPQPQDTTVRKGRRAGSASSQRSTEPPWATGD